MSKIDIRIMGDAYMDGYEGAFYRYTTEDGKESACGIWDYWYTADAVDEAGKHYTIVWAIEDMDAFNRGDEDCCDWGSPDEIKDEDGNVVTDKVRLVW